MRGPIVTQQPVDLSQLSPRYARDAVSYIRTHAHDYHNDTHERQPFFLMMSFSHAHVSVPRHLQWCSAPFNNRSPHGPYGDAIEEMDWVAGTIMQTLHDEHIEKNTIGMCLVNSRLILITRTMILSMDH
jgi:arylsulfatase A